MMNMAEATLMAAVGKREQEEEGRSIAMGGGCGCDKDAECGGRREHMSHSPLAFFCSSLELLSASSSARKRRGEGASVTTYGKLAKMTHLAEFRGGVRISNPKPCSEHLKKRHPSPGMCRLVHGFALALGGGPLKKA